ncbi:hypothetical protein [Aureivirga sp. CE67]|uniref:hypothetical protein n=1 Tax=Aureivirga sp. CE67 TaxID=1788983 RepID=UPI0018C96E05|nr:hypothetical protein [Aureivirga sp. CE67]
MEDNKLYNFDKSYHNDWTKFISFFQNVNLEEDSLVSQIKECCEYLNEKIRYLYESEPNYGSQMEIRFEWKDLKVLLVKNNSIFLEYALDWFSSELVNMINSDNPKVVDSIWYILGVDYFECTEDGYWILPKIYEKIPEKFRKKLIAYTASIPWKSKIETYKEIVLNPNYHESLADVIYNSCFALCHYSCFSYEALEILRKLDISKTKFQEVFEILTKPVQVEFVNFLKIEEKSIDDVKGFITISAQKYKRIPTWFPYAELWVDTVFLGNFEEKYYDFRWNGWNSISSKYNIEINFEQGTHEFFFPLKKIPFTDWNDKKFFIKPINRPLE